MDGLGPRLLAVLMRDLAPYCLRRKIACVSTPHFLTLLASQFPDEVRQSFLNPEELGKLPEKLNSPRPRHRLIEWFLALRNKPAARLSFTPFDESLKALIVSAIEVSAADGRKADVGDFLSVLIRDPKTIDQLRRETGLIVRCV